MQNKSQLPTDFFELLNRYPSPHNGQPVVLQETAANQFDLFFDPQRGLQAAEISYLFSFVTMGLFVRYMTLCAEACGYGCTFTVKLPKLSKLKTSTPLYFASCRITSSVKAPIAELLATLRFRQTSRKKYSQGLPEAVAARTNAIADEHHMQLVKMNHADTHQAIWLNQRAVFDDMFDDAVRHELDHWLRYSKVEKETKMDGLAYDCMELDGRVMRFIVKYYKVLRMPGVSSLLKKYYLRTMSDNSDVYYLLAPFSNEQEAFDVGDAVMRIWTEIAGEGYFLHPFGTIMSNEAAHRDFLKLAHIDYEDRHTNFLVFIYRAGKSENPHRSIRLPVNEHLLRSKDV